MPEPQLINVGGTVIRDSEGKYLMVQEKRADIYGLWNIPAGQQDAGETLQQTAIRETAEEVGLLVELLDSDPIHIEKSKHGHICHSFAAEIVGGRLDIQHDEIIKAVWLSFDEIKRLNAKGKIRAPWTMTSIQKVEDENSGD